MRSVLVAALGVAAVGAASSLPALASAKTTHADAGRTESAAFTLKPLSAKDVRAYAAAFAAVREGRFDDAQALAKTISDPLLLGRLTYVKLMHPDYPATYEELAAWMERYRDQPDADRIYTLARKRRPDAGAALTSPEAAGDGDPAIWARVESLAQRVEAASAAPPAPAVFVREPNAPTTKVDPGLQAAREAFYRGEVERAYKLAVNAGERWIAGLAAFRMKRYEEAQGRFSALALDETVDEWTRSGAGYWASRAAIAAGAPEAAPAYLGIAARAPYTFYGLIAERQLGLDPAVTAQGLDPALAPPATKPARSTTAVGGSAGASVAGLIKGDKRARRAAAYAQLGMKAESGAELRAGLVGASGDRRQSWTRLGLALNAPLTSPTDLTRGRQVRFDIAQYPTPELAPQGGFTLDKALVYALVRQESKFDAAASSAGGAWGLMQLMPATAARVAGDDKLKADPRPLRDPALNLRLGQDYVARLLTAVNGDLLHAVAAYNSGPGVILKTLTQMGKNTDSLLAIESMPGAQTRDYVEKVVAGYWIYRNIFGQDSPTLDAAASAKRSVAAALDKPMGAAITAKLVPDVLANLFQPTAAQ
ncbi:MAG TPA: transglycosylase SLT domain-containing protein [Caulobacteraceae bacterium]|nr:transglycosylase SLT domain-containing protein [Caulobacteraceae bacterium]